MLACQRPGVLESRTTVARETFVAPGNLHVEQAMA